MILSDIIKQGEMRSTIVIPQVSNVKLELKMENDGALGLGICQRCLQTQDKILKLPMFGVIVIVRSPGI